MAVGEDEVGEDEEANVYVIDIDNYHGSEGAHEGTIVITDKDTPLPPTITKWTVMVQKNVNTSDAFTPYYEGQRNPDGPHGGRSRIKIWKIVRNNWRKYGENTGDFREDWVLSRRDAQTEIDNMVDTARAQMTLEEVWQSPEHQGMASQIQQRVRLTQEQADAKMRLYIINHVQLKNQRDATGYSDPEMLRIINHLSDLVYGNRPIRTTGRSAFPGGPFLLEPLFFIDPFQWRKEFFPDDQGELFNQLYIHEMYERNDEDYFQVIF
jgi:D-ribose pyranose/furanose isomerase RbsD